MAKARTAPLRLCFAVLFVVGTLMLLYGMFVVRALPYFQLDALLTPTELANQEKRQETFDLLLRAGGIQWLLWSVAGAVVVSLSAFGLRSIRRTEIEPPE